MSNSSGCVLKEEGGVREQGHKEWPNGCLLIFFHTFTVKQHELTKFSHRDIISYEWINLSASVWIRSLLFAVFRASLSTFSCLISVVDMNMLTCNFILSEWSKKRYRKCHQIIPWVKRDVYSDI